MAARGVGEGDRVAILSRNRIEFFELLFGCAKLGAILVPLNWRMPPAELDGLIADAEPVLLFHGAERRRRGRRPRRRAGPRSISTAIMRRCSRPLRPGRARPRWPAESTWYLLYTSGTTGRPKGVIYTYRMALANYVNIGAAIDLASTDTTPTFLPIFHTAGINLHALPTLIAGGRVIVHGRLRRRRAGRPDRGRGGSTPSSPCRPSIRALLDHPRFAAAPLDACPPLGLRRRAAARRAGRALPRARRARLQRHGHDRDRPDRLPGRSRRRLGPDRLGRQAATAVQRPHRRRRRPRRRRRRGRRPACSPARA